MAKVFNMLKEEIGIKKPHSLGVRIISWVIIASLILAVISFLLFVPAVFYSIVIWFQR